MIPNLSNLVALYAIAFALQRLADILEATWSAVAGGAADAAEARKRAMLGWVGIACGVPAGWWLPVLGALGYSPPRWIDVAVTALVVSGGSEWFNALVKLANYAKEQKKEDHEAARAERALTETVAAGVGRRSRR